MPQIAMSLFAQEKISQQQIYSVLEHRQIKSNFPKIFSYKILNENGEFTEEEKKYFTPIFKPSLLKHLSTLQIKEFRLLILSLPPSENVFHVTEKLADSQKESLFLDLFEISFRCVQ